MRAAPLQRPPELFAREPRNKTHHALAGGATGGAWCVLLRGSRARACGPRRYRRARMYSGGMPLADFGETWVFGFLGNSEKAAPGAGSSTLVSKTAPSRARPLKNILAGPDGSGGQPEPSAPVRMFFTGRGREGSPPGGWAPGGERGRKLPK